MYIYHPCQSVCFFLTLWLFHLRLLKQAEARHKSANVTYFSYMTLVAILLQGGQILRNSSALSCILNKPIRIRNIRAARSKPGLRYVAVRLVYFISGIGLLLSYVVQNNLFPWGCVTKAIMDNGFSQQCL